MIVDCECIAVNKTDLNIMCVMLRLVFLCFSVGG